MSIIRKQVHVLHFIECNEKVNKYRKYQQYYPERTPQIIWKYAEYIFQMSDILLEYVK